MLKPSENIIRVPHKSQYALVIAVAKRAREITDEIEAAGEELINKPVELAVRDFVAEKFLMNEPDPFDYDN
ncbi:MAG: DNA-directed RNA polymerase subunit omega [Clostridia bacterium]|nr:DNA-directed RNA polymerase subunit omega [Clostridia bacterium]